LIIKKILDQYQNNEKALNAQEYSLSAISGILSLLDNPQKRFHSVHIAGTNGKGTTSWILSAILEESGCKTGLYTSPHLVSVNERIRVNRTLIPDREFEDILLRIEHKIHQSGLVPTYFDILTIAAFIYFAEQNVDIAVIETGLGGRLDSTNVINPLMSLITDISLDHTGVLGNTIEEIAREKAGIIKSSGIVITTNSYDSGLGIIEDISDLLSARLLVYGRDFYCDNIIAGVSNVIFNYYNGNNLYHGICLPLFPAHHARNCALALTSALCLSQMGFNIADKDQIIRLLSTINVPGRCQKLGDTPLIFYDPAHNFTGIYNLLSHIESFFKDKRIYVVLALMGDKATPEILSYLKSRPYPVLYYLLNDERAYVPRNCDFLLVTDRIDVIMDNITADNRETLILFTGTFRIYNTALQFSVS